jgi:hypothetical protein
MSIKLCRRYFIAALLIVVAVSAAPAQQRQSSLRGLITDEQGGAIVGASVTLLGADGQLKTTASSDEGTYLFDGLAPGKYTVRASGKGFASADAAVELKAGQRESLDLTLKVTIEEQKVTVATATALSTDANANANQIVIGAKELDGLPDDPDELAAALQALAGPSLGPNGGQIVVDGFSGGTLPSKLSIREVRTNQNPFAAENDLPLGRIDVFTRPGTDKLRGSAFLNFNDESFNSRNPFAAHRAPYQVRQFGGNISGPLAANKASYFVDFERREVNDNELLTATILDSNLSRLTIADGVLTPRRFINFSARVDYAFNPRHTMIVRYSFLHSNLANNGVGGFSLPERGYDALSDSHNIRIGETAILSPRTISETLFQFTRSRNEQLGDSSRPALVVSGSFIGGGSQVGHSINTDQRWELQNYTAVQKGQHLYKVGGRLRGVRVDNISPSNFGGQYVFTGGEAPQLDANNNAIPGTAIAVDSLERYRRTLLFQRQGLTATEIRARGGGAAQFSINTGNPEASVSQFDISVYGQDDWRIRPNLTLSYGLRYEYQTNTVSPFNFAPRAAIAWSPGASDPAHPAKSVIRAGFGVFYNRFNETATLQARRFNGTNEQQFILRENSLFNSSGQLVLPVSTPLDAFPNLPPIAGLATASRQITYRVAPDLTTPAIYSSGVQIERQLPYKFVMVAGVFHVQIQHSIRLRDINAPLPGSITTALPEGIRPLGKVGDVYQFESSGRFNQNQIYLAFNNRFSRNISFFGNYSLGHYRNDTDGFRNFPANSYDVRGEYGRAAVDTRHRFSFGGSWSTPWWGVSLSPFILASSGGPFNITTGTDTNGDGQFTERPSFAAAGVTCSGPSKPTNVICTPFGNFNLQPAVGEQLIPRNFGTSPAYFLVNLTMSKSLSFGTVHSGKSAATSAPKAEPGTQGGAKTSAAVASPPAKAAASGEKRYTMQFALAIQNLFNRANLQQPEGNFSSPYFGESLGLNGFGGFGGPGSAGAGNRRITGRVRFIF